MASPLKSVPKREAKDDDEVWSDAEVYTISIRLDDRRCIAPTLKRTQCSKRDKVDLQSIHDQILELQSAEDILRAVRKLVLQRCCNQYHRQKLRTRPKCHQMLAERYIDAYAKQKLLLVPVPRGLDVVNDDTIAIGVLEPYVPAKEVIMSSRLKEPMIKENGRDFDATGVVYGFTSSAWKDVVKIGYSKVSAAARMRDYASCMPHGKIVLEQRFPFPERMEQLIHLELNSQRRKVERCKSCNRGHEEFFQMLADEVKVLVGEWKEVIDMEPLYNAKTRKLTPAWQRRLEKLKVNATAFELKKLLIAEREQELTVKLEEELIVKPEEELNDKSMLANQPARATTAIHSRPPPTAASPGLREEKGPSRRVVRTPAKAQIAVEDSLEDIKLADSNEVSCKPSTPALRFQHIRDASASVKVVA